MKPLFSPPLILSEWYHVSHNLAEQRNHALVDPLGKPLPRLKAKYFLYVYTRDDLHNKTVFKLQG